MALQECANGHLYDTDQYPTCPYCRGGTNVINFAAQSNVGKTVAAANAVIPPQGMAPQGMPPQQVMPQQITPPNEVGATVAPQSYIKQQQQQQQNAADVGKTVGVFQRKMNFEPIVGWLVCVGGPEKGKDFRIYGKNNTIGRSEKMDICIKGDQTISRENHARLAYDEKHNAFHLIPADSTNTIYLNDEPVYVPTKLNARDIIEFGECKLMFVPLCDENFTWKSVDEAGK